MRSVSALLDCGDMLLLVRHMLVQASGITFSARSVRQFWFSGLKVTAAEDYADDVLASNWPP